MAVGKLQASPFYVGNLQVVVFVGNLTVQVFLVGTLTPSRSRQFPPDLATEATSACGSTTPSLSRKATTYETDPKRTFGFRLFSIVCLIVELHSRP